MADPQGLVKFPGIDYVVDWSMSLSHGISPSVCMVTIAPQKRFPRDAGKLEITFDNVKLEFPDCKADSISYERNSAGLIWRLAIFDRRWKWAFGEIGGYYNERQADGKVDKSTEKTPQELAKLCLEAMGEKDYNVDALPNEARPEIAWDADIPAQALGSLVESLGCRVVLTNKNSVRICKLGEGEKLPRDSSVMDESGTIDPAERPDSIILLGAIERYQRQLKLEPVGVDVDGKIKPIDELSYKPSGGWENFPANDDVWLNFDDCKVRKLASETVFRWYKVTGYRDGTLNFPEFPQDFEMKHIKQIFPLENELVEQEEDKLDDNRKRNKPAKVVGTYWVPSINGTNSDSTGASGTVQGAPTAVNCDEVVIPFSLDRARGIVMFSFPMVLEDNDTKGKWGPAKIYLECAFGLRDHKTREFRRWRKEHKFGGKKYNTKPRIYRDDSLAYTNHKPIVGGASLPLVTNEAELNKFAEPQLKALAAEYEQTTPEEVTYAGLKEISPDGAIQQVSWRGGLNGCTTTASRNTEHNNYLPSYGERRMLEKESAATKAIQPPGVNGLTLNSRKFMDSQGKQSYA